MQRRERARAQLCFALLGCLAVLIFGRLLYMQGNLADANRAQVLQQKRAVEVLPAARGTIVDAKNRRLAYDRPVLEIRAGLRVKLKGKRQQSESVQIPAAVVQRVATRLAQQFAGAKPSAARQADMAQRLRGRIQNARCRSGAGGRFARVDFLVATQVDQQEVILGLQELQKEWNRRGSEEPGRLNLQFLRQYVRTYPGREVTHGVVGNYFIQDRVWDAERRQEDVHEVFTGMESFAGLWPKKRIGSQGQALSFERVLSHDARGRHFWSAKKTPPPQPDVMRCSLNLDLQKAAHESLLEAAAQVEAKYKSPMAWGGILLISLQTGDVLAMASHYPGKADEATAFVPLQNLFEPGSVVKPLTFAMALESGKLGWHEEIDCTPTMPGYGWRVSGHRRRIIRDVHACGVLDPQGVLVQSSNIGAVQVGQRLGREGFKDYMQRYGFTRSTTLGLPGERAGKPSRNLDTMSDRQLGRFTGPSLSFGYEMTVNMAQLARAYLCLLSGRQRELRLVTGVEHNGRFLANPIDQGGERFLSPQTVAYIRQAMARVVSDEPGATGSRLFKMLRELGYEGQLMGGKTGTSDSPIKASGSRMKTATFVGFTPVDAPRYLAVCVVRKNRASRFYGGSYAAPAAGRLLLAALAQEQLDQRHQVPQVSAWLSDVREAVPGPMQTGR